MKCKLCSEEIVFNNPDLEGACWKCNDEVLILQREARQYMRLEDITSPPSTIAKGIIKDEELFEGLMAAEEPKSRLTTLPTDSAERKEFPLFRGCLKYFPAALAGVARISFLGNQKHNPGEDLHHARSKSMDHGDCILRHLTDTTDLIAAIERGQDVDPQQALDEVNQLAWRVLAFSQELHERLGNAPLAPGAKK